MGILSILGRIGKFALSGGGIGRLVKGAVNVGKKVLGKVSPLVKKGFGFIQKIPGFLGIAKKKKDQITDDIKDAVGKLPDSQIKDKLQNMVDRGDKAVDKVFDKGKDITDKAMPWVQAGQNIMQPIMKYGEQGPVRRPAVIPQGPQQQQGFNQGYNQGPQQGYGQGFNQGGYGMARPQVMPPGYRM